MIDNNCFFKSQNDHHRYFFWKIKLIAEIILICEILSSYRENGLKKQSELIPFETARFKRETRLKARKTPKPASITPAAHGPNRFLPQYGDYSLKAILDLDYEKKETHFSKTMKKRTKKSKWNRKKEKTGRRLLLKHGCILTLADPIRGDSTDDTS